MLEMAGIYVVGRPTNLIFIFAISIYVINNCTKNTNSWNSFYNFRS